MKNRFIRIAAFFAILLGLLLIVGLIFHPKNNDYKSGMQERIANSILAEPENTIDVVFLGDSEAYCAFIPLRIWENAGITSYVSSIVDQKFYQAPEYMKTAFRNQKPGIVVLETNTLYRGSVGTDMLSHLAERALPVLRYHDRWKKLRSYDWFRRPEYTEINAEKGYHHSLKAEPADTSEYMLPTDEVEEIPSGNLKILDYMNRYCLERGAQLVLVSSPSTQNWDYLRHNAVKAAAKKLEIPYVDMNCLQEEIPIDWDTDTLDGGDHMNYYGAAKVTDYMTEYFVKSGRFTDKRQQPEYEPWNRLAAEFDPFASAE